MPRFRVTPRTGSQGSLLVEAADASMAPGRAGLSPLEVLAVEKIGDAPSGAGAPIEAAPPAAGFRAGLDLRSFSRELATLLDAGIPLLESLVTLGERHSTPVIAAVIAALRDGRPLSAALATQARSFDPLFVAVVAASERSGSLAHALRHHADYLAFSQRLRNRLTAAAIYPLLLLASGGAVVLFLLLYVLPRFAVVFEQLPQELPLASRWLVELGLWCRAHPQTLLLLVAALAATLLASATLPALRARIVQAAQALAFALPGLGPPLRTVAPARLYRALGLLLGAGIPVLQALQLGQGVLAPAQRPALARARDAVAAGTPLSQALHAQGLATPVALRMLRVGERSGQLAAMLDRAAAFHDEDAERAAELVTRIVNPLLMLLMGAVIGAIVVWMYLPIFTLMEQVG